MSKVRPGLPDVWASNITGYLAGEEFCLFKSWYLARHYVRGDGDFDRAAWIAEHGAMVRARAATCAATGATVRVENQNAFVVRGQAATVTGKPDLVVIEPEAVLVSDAKTGQRKLADRQQVLVYMWALGKPTVRPDLAGKVIHGEIVYKDGIEPVGAHELTDAVRQRIGDTVRQISFPMPPEAVPSEKECRYCRLSLEQCPKKMHGPRAEGTTEEF